jgi:NAD(P)-dependent dehydrogenase (short-subunit alcohol dehydrogenase family)
MPNMSLTLPPDYTPKHRLLKDRFILVTGAGDGLGRATALACAGLGATVVLLGRTVAKLEQVYDAILQGGGATPAIYPLNLAGASWNDYQELADTLERELGKLDGIVHCAAHFKTFAALEDVDPREWVEGLQVNLTGAYTLTRLCLPLMRKSSDASVVFVADASGRKPKAFHGIYGIAKTAVEAMAKTWAQEIELEPGLRINTFDPGPLRTQLRIKGYPGELMDKIPAPETAVPTLLWLLGPDSRGVSGQAF